MINEQRALTTLDLALKNAFETLNKFSVWATTPNADVTFNLVDAVPTINSNGTGIFLKPIKVPSFNSITTTIFGPIGTTSARTINWGLVFQANGQDWTFQNYSQGNNSSNPVAGKPSTLNIFVDSKFGNANTPVSITKTNVTEVAYNSSMVYDLDSYIAVSGEDAVKTVLLSNSTSYLKSGSITLGADVVSGLASSNLIAYVNKLLITNGNRNILVYGYTPASGKSIVRLGALSSSYDTTIMGGNVNILGWSNKNFAISIGSDRVHDYTLLSSTPSSTGYAVNLAVPDNTTIKSMLLGDVTSLEMIASDRMYLHTDSDYIDTKDSEGNFVIGTTKKLQLNGGSGLVLASDTKVSLGVDTGSGIANEIVVTKGRVEIPNLFIAKKSNYTLSGIKHRSVLYPALSLEYIPSQKAMTTIPNGYTHALEYVVDIADDINVNLDAISAYDTTINEFSGDRKSYIVFYKEGSVHAYTADVDSTNNITSEYSTEISIAGIVLDGTELEYPRVFSTSNYMYVFVLKPSNVDIYYSSNASTFAYLHSIENRDKGEYEEYYTFDNLADFSIDIVSTSNPLEDVIWVASTFGLKYDNGYSGTDIVNIVNTCGAPVMTRNPNGYHGALPSINVNNATGAASQANGSAKIKSYIEQDGTVYAILAVPVFYSRTNSGVKCAAGSAYLKAIVSEGVVKYVDGSVLYDGLEVYFTTNYTKPYFGPGAGDVDTISQSGKIIDFTFNPTTNAFTSYIEYSNAAWYTSYNTKTTQGSTNKHLTKSFVSTDTGNISAMSYLTSAYIETNYVFDLNNPSIAIMQGYNRVLSLNSFAKNNKNTIGYTIGMVEYSILLATIQHGLQGEYDIYGSFVDYFNVGASVTGVSDYRFLLSNSVSGKNVYKLHSEIDNPVGSDTSEVFDESGNLIAIVDMGTAQFSERSSLISRSNTITPIEIFIGNAGPNGTRNYNLKTGELDKATYDSASSTYGNFLSIYANVHIEPISYIAKNRTVDIDGVSFAGYTIKNETTSFAVNAYSLKLANNSRSGYKIPFYSKLADAQVYQSSYNTSKSSKANIGVDFQYDANVNIFVFPRDKYTYVVFTNDRTLSFSVAADILQISNAHVVIKIETKYLDPTDGSFDSSLSVVNEFGNVVSIKADYISGYRAGMLFTLNHASIVTGLTEIAQAGGGC